MPERIPCEFYLLRYVPDPVKCEFVNIGVLLREAGRAETTRVRLTRDWSRVRCIDPDADTALLEAMEAELYERVREVSSDNEPGMKVLENSLSISLQITEVRGTLAESVVAEMEQLMRLYVEPVREKKQRRVSGRAAIVNTMRGEFERAGVWDLMRKRISAGEYTRPGDPLRLDCGYRFATQSKSPLPATVRVFQAVSLDGDLEAAKVLSYSAARLRAGVERKEQASLDLAAVIEPLRSVAGRNDGDGDTTEAAERYRFGVETMEEADIRVVTLNDLPRVAETAKRELRV